MVHIDEETLLSWMYGNYLSREIVRKANGISVYHFWGPSIESGMNERTQELFITQRFIYSISLLRERERCLLPFRG